MRIKHLLLLVSIGASLTACSLDGLLNEDNPPDETKADPNKVATYEGAVALYYTSIHALTDALNIVSEDVGTITDELTMSLDYGGAKDYLDARSVAAGEDGLESYAYAKLQTARVTASHAVTALQRYGPASAKPQLGHAYALQAQAILQLAEMFCSGVPLTEVTFDGGMKYTAGLSTETLLETAVVLFDSAYSYGKDSLPIATFAQVGKGRALLSLGKYTEAAAAVNGVPTNAAYTVTLSGNDDGVKLWTWSSNVGPDPYRTLNNEGGNGIKWASDSAWTQDPRVPFLKVSDSVFSNPLRQTKLKGATGTFVIANGIQARMIEAESQLQPANNPSGPWLATLNDARATIGLSPLTDPGTVNGRIDLLFRERGFWFYLNGQRLGDMRRLVRNYGRLAMQVYPAGTYPGFSIRYPTYGNEYVFVPQKLESDYNPLYKGCINTRP